MEHYMEGVEAFSQIPKFGSCLIGVEHGALHGRS